MIRPSHHRASAAQQAWIVFGGHADMGWQRLLRPGFRHCFAALQDDAGWLVLDPLSRRLVVARVEVPADFDLPGFYRRAGLEPLGPFAVGEAQPGWLPAWLPMNCVGLCRAVLGARAPFAVTPAGLHTVLTASADKRKKCLTLRIASDYTTIINGRAAPEAKPAPLTRALAFFSSIFAPWPVRRHALVSSLFKAPKPVRVEPPAPPPTPIVASPAQATEQAAADTQARARRGIQGTIVTSELGVLAPAPALLTRKSLLGE